MGEEKTKPLTTIVLVKSSAPVGTVDRAGWMNSASDGFGIGPRQDSYKY